MTEKKGFISLVTEEDTVSLGERQKGRKHERRRRHVAIFKR
jgi:hypothetical protein